MCEDVFQIYRRCGESVTLMASDLSIYDAVLLMQAWMQENFNDQLTSLELRRQPMDYGKRCAAMTGGEE